MAQAFSSKVVQLGWRLSGQCPWDLRAFLERFSGFHVFTPVDFEKISSVFPQLIMIAHGTGTLHESQVRRFLADWIKDVQMRALSLEARYMLAKDELENGLAEDKKI